MTHPKTGDAPRESDTDRDLGRSLAAIVAHLAAERERLDASVATVSDQDLYRRPAAEAWSVGEVLDHLHRVETGVATLIAKRVRQAKAEGALPAARDESDAEVAAALASLDRFRIETVTRRVEAAEPARPQGAQPKSELLDALRRSRAALLAAVADAAGYDLTALRYPHRMLGDIDLRQWVLFVAKHERRHVAQIEAARGAITAPARAGSTPEPA